MVENGIDSYKFSLEQYQKYVNFNNKYDQEAGTHLKATVIFLQNALEIFNKLILSKHNELLIFEIRKPEHLLKIMKDKEKIGIPGSLHEFVGLIQDSSVKTINFEEAVNRIEILYDLTNSSAVQVMRKLNQLRNAITHFAYVAEFEFYKIMLDIDNAYRLIYEFYSDNLDIDSIHINEFNELIERSLDLLEVTEFQIPSYWESYFDVELENISEVFNLLEKDKAFQDECFNRGVKLKINNNKYLISTYFDIEITDINDSENIHRITPILMPEIDTIAFFSEEDPNQVKLLIEFDITKKEVPKLLFSKTPIEIDDNDRIIFRDKYEKSKKTYIKDFKLETLKGDILKYVDSLNR
jgi:hypothetical protein